MSKLDKDSTFSNLGLDSLMAVDIIQRLRRGINAPLETGDLEQLTFGKLEKMAENYYDLHKGSQ